MGNTSALWSEIEVENSGSGCVHEMQIEIKPRRKLAAADIQFI